MRTTWDLDHSDRTSVSFCGYININVIKPNNTQYRSYTTTASYMSYGLIFLILTHGVVSRCHRMMFCSLFTGAVTSYNCNNENSDFYLLYTWNTTANWLQLLHCIAESTGSWPPWDVCCVGNLSKGIAHNWIAPSIDVRSLNSGL